MWYWWDSSFGTAIGRKRGVILEFSDFCKLTYRRSTSVPNQRVFAKKLFESTGAKLHYSDGYYQNFSMMGKNLVSIFLSRFQTQYNITR